MARALWKGNEAMAEAAVRAGCEAYFGYPITPQTELLEYMARRMPELGRAFVQAESELGAINMVYGAACTGARTMTSSSGPGISLMQEGLSYIAASEVPAVLIDVMRVGPGLGNIQPSQGDYNQLVKFGGHGDFKVITLAPATVQEAVDLTVLAFDLADKYRSLVYVAADGSIGQMMEPADMPPMRPLPTTRPAWALTGNEGRPHNIITSLYLNPDEMEKLNLTLQAKLQVIRQSELRYKEHLTDDADIIIAGFGTMGRVAYTTVKQARAEGLRVGLFRPISLFPFPYQRLAELAGRAKGILVVEMNAGQMLEDVRLGVEGRCPVHFYGRMGGLVPLPEDILGALREIREALVQT
ncbi:MAG: 3-methyl-2-oxobutanoate dehydrogenase subunit VorB [Thermoflexales bacterium]|nr:3-methyl-2-oxobutanoate dehydrogenase subunit VorB [Thermoflexales bacterium]